MTQLKTDLRAAAYAAGFAKMGVCAPDAIPQAHTRLRAFVHADHHGSMEWMTQRMAQRGNPKTLWPAVRSIIMLADLYTPKTDPMAALNQRDCATISVYAQNRDYHDVVKKRLKHVGRWLLDAAQKGGAPHPEIKVFVDTAPVMEKPLAQAAGLGWQGKHTNLLARDLGNWFFLGAIFTTIPLDPDPPAVDHCGMCRACLDVCPTDAFPAPFQMDARRCISYLTIEHKGPVDVALRPKLGNRVYGCDDCLAVCPWNKFAVAAAELRYAARPDLQGPPLETLVTLDDAGFRARFAGTAIKRIGRGRFVRNVLYAIGNSGERRLKSVAQKLVDDADAVVADAARWAVGQLS